MSSSNKKKLTNSHANGIYVTTAQCPSKKQQLPGLGFTPGSLGQCQHFIVFSELSCKEAVVVWMRGWIYLLETGPVILFTPTVVGEGAFLTESQKEILKSFKYLNMLITLESIFEQFHCFVFKDFICIVLKNKAKIINL